MKRLIYLLLFSNLVACSSKKQTINFYDANYGYAETVVIEESDKTTIYISGQVGAGTTLEEQMRNTLVNLKAQLNKHEADYKNLVKINTYIVDYTPADLAVFRDVRKEIFGSEITPASTLVGVQSLAKPEWKIEIDAVAILMN